jgi:hypothetical protein
MHNRNPNHLLHRFPTQQRVEERWLCPEHRARDHRFWDVQRRTGISPSIVNATATLEVFVAAQAAGSCTRGRPTFSFRPFQFSLFYAAYDSTRRPACPQAAGSNAASRVTGRRVQLKIAHFLFLLPKSKAKYCPETVLYCQAEEQQIFPSPRGRKCTIYMSASGCRVSWLLMGSLRPIKIDMISPAKHP